MSRPSYDKRPVVAVPGTEGSAVCGWDAIAERLAKGLPQSAGSKIVMAVECYPGVDEAMLMAALRSRLRPSATISTAEALLPPEKVDALVAPFLGGDDPVFGFLCDLTLPQFFDEGRLAVQRRQIEGVNGGLVLVVGCATSLVAKADILVYADLARWEAQLRFRRQESGNLGANNLCLSAGLKYKRAFFVDWRVADRWKRPLLARAEYFLDTHVKNEPKMAAGDAIRRGFLQASSRPFRVVPFFDPAPWGGQWMKEVCDLDRSTPNYGWCFDCVPEENSLILSVGAVEMELPAIDLVFDQPGRLLGESVRARFGDEFPIRFDFLDTMGGGNLSFQVHPLAEYIRRHFGMSYTQDESYYILDAGSDSGVYLGLKEGVDPKLMIQALRAAQAGGPGFQAEQFANRWPASPHDHFLIPAGTVHCSGKNTMVLEISATPFIFTFKLWDWGRLGLDGKPRPIYLDHGAANICWERTAEWTRKNLINAFRPVTSGEGWIEEHTGLHDLEFIETRRHRFNTAVSHDTVGGLNVLNLVSGQEAVVESPDRAFAPFIVHYAETFIVPAAVGPYSIRPHGVAHGRQCMTIKAFVRSQT